MENNSDKEMRDKLKGVDVPFDPKAWEQMETMLNEDRKPRAFFWWWFGGVAACLLLVTAIIGYYQFGHNSSTSNAPMAVSQNEVGNNTAPSNSNSQIPAPSQTSTSENTNGGAVENNPVKNEGNKVNNTNPVQNPSRTASTTLETSPATSKLEKSKTTNTPKSGKQHLGMSSKTNTVGPAAEKHVKKNGGHQRNEGNSGNNVAQQTTLVKDQAPANGTASSEALAQTVTAGERAKLTDPISMEPILTYEFPNGNEKTDEVMQKEDGGDVNLKKLKKNIFNYSLGVEANISGVTLGHQTGASITDAFSHTPSYMVGFTHDFMFFKRFAITNSILFSQTSFSVFGAKTTYATNLASYSSNITELAIPIGVKVYAVSKPKFRFYISAGIINHIKLKETFTYRYNDNASAGAGYLPSQNQFNGNQDPAITASLSSAYGYYGAYDVSINQGRRYYVSFCASAGAEFIVQKHFVFFAEPVFDMALQKVGVQNKYKYDLGLTGGLRYQF